MFILRQVNLGLGSRLNAATFAVIAPSSLHKDDKVDSEGKLREVFDTFKETIAALGITDEICLVTSRFTGDPEEISYYVMFKKRENGKDIYSEGEAALFIVDLDPSLKSTSIRYGFGGCDAGKYLRIDEATGEMRNIRRFLSVSELQDVFKRFLDFVLPKVIKWDKAYADGVLKQTRAGDTLLPWLAVRIVQNHPGDYIEIGDGEWNRNELCGILAEGQASLIKIGDAGLTVG